MIGRRFGRLAAALLLAGVSPCEAQTWHADSSLRQFSWGPVNVLVRADTAYGLQLWAGTASVGYNGTRHAFHADFDPDTLTNWINLAHAVVSYRQRVEGDSVPDLRTPPMYSTDSSWLIVLRKRKGSGWSERPQLVFLDTDDTTPWAVDASASEANALIEALFVTAASSRLSPVPVIPSVPARDPLDASRVTAEPRLLKAGKMDIPRPFSSLIQPSRMSHTTA